MPVIKVLIKAHNTKDLTLCFCCTNIAFHRFSVDICYEKVSNITYIAINMISFSISQKEFQFLAKQ